MNVCNNEHIKENQRSKCIVPCLFCCHPGMSLTRSRLMARQSSKRPYIYVFKGTAGPSISCTMENITNVQIVQLDAEMPIINSGHPTLWASAPKQWSPKRKSSETVGIWMNDHQWTEDNIQQARDSCLPAREAFFGEVAINIALEVGVFSHNTYCSVVRPGQLA
jgi:hypothetical protein